HEHRRRLHPRARPGAAPGRPPGRQHVQRRPRPPVRARRAHPGDGDERRFRPGPAAARPRGRHGVRVPRRPLRDVHRRLGDAGSGPPPGDGGAVDRLPARRPRRGPGLGRVAPCGSRARGGPAAAAGGAQRPADRARPERGRPLRALGGHPRRPPEAGADLAARPRRLSAGGDPLRGGGSPRYAWIYSRLVQLFHEHEQVVVCHEPEAGLRAIIAVHDTTLGPALGGIRMWRYDSDEAALTDVLRLSRGMTYKNAVAGLDLGGGKTVVLGDPRTDKTPLLFRALGRFVDSLGGRYLAAEDVGTSTDDAELVALETDHITGLPIARGGSGDPSPMTAWGVFCGMGAAAVEAGLGDDMRGIRVAVQGAGHVGAGLVRHLLDAGAVVTVSDIYSERVEALVALGASACPPDEVHRQDC